MEVRVFITIKQALTTKIIVEKKTDLVDHSYFLALDIEDMDLQLNKPIRQTRVVNTYDNRMK